LALSAPLFGIIAIAIKLDSPGPLLFGQMREGYHNKVFRLWKFRTMYHGCRDEGAVQQTSRNDRRVTRVGRVLRRFSLDELPQLINVIRGEMSIVGPRPHALGMTCAGLPMTQVLEGYAARLRLKPGITGWAQVNGCRGEVDSHEKLHRRVSLDCHYIDHWSLSLDLWIVLRTAVLLLFDRGAY
jgi:lipopolysaccharide/colanic/teichoic acid biosynthesis glycosyltransferase